MADSVSISSTVAIALYGAFDAMSTCDYPSAARYLSKDRAYIIESVFSGKTRTINFRACAYRQTTDKLVASITGVTSVTAGDTEFIVTNGTDSYTAEVTAATQTSSGTAVSVDFLDATVGSALLAAFQSMSSSDYAADVAFELTNGINVKLRSHVSGNDSKNIVFSMTKLDAKGMRYIAVCMSGVTGITSDATAKTFTVIAGYESYIISQDGTLIIKYATQEELDNEISAREAADDQLQNDINTEVAARSAADTVLANHIASLEEGLVYNEHMYSASDTWTIVNTLGHLTSVQAYNVSGNMIYGNFYQKDDAQVIITFSAPVTGYAVLR